MALNYVSAWKKLSLTTGRGKNIILKFLSIYNTTNYNFQLCFTCCPVFQLHIQLFWNYQTILSL